MSRTRDRIARLHALSGILIAFYASLHLLNHAAAFSGPDAFASFRSLLRKIYQFPPYEIACLAAPILFNMASGVYLSRQDRGDAPPPAAGMRRRLHRWSGVCLLALLLPHAVSTRGLNLLWEVDTGFHFVAGTLSGSAAPVFWLSYSLLVVAAAYHLPNGLFTFLDDAGSFPGSLSRRLAAGAFILIGATLFSCGFLGLLSYGGILYPPPAVEPLPLNPP